MSEAADSKAGHTAQVLARKLGSLRREHRTLQRACDRYRLIANELVRDVDKHFRDRCAADARVEDLQIRLAATTKLLDKAEAPEPCTRSHTTPALMLLFFLCLIGAAVIGAQLRTAADAHHDTAVAGR